MRKYQSRVAVKALFIVVAGWMSVAAHAAVVTFSDNTLLVADYSFSLFTGQSLVASVVTTPTDGNPGSALVTSVNGTGPFSYSFAAIRPGFTYDPTSSGAVSSIDVSLDRIASRTIGGAASNVETYSLRPLISQGGFLYQPSTVAIFAGNSQWITMSLTDLDASDFGRWDTTTDTINAALHPDFNAPMTLGFVTAGRFSQAQTTYIETQTINDNWVVTLRTVPEPGTLALLGLGLAGLAASRRRQAVIGNA